MPGLQVGWAELVEWGPERTLKGKEGPENYQTFKEEHNP